MDRAEDLEEGDGDSVFEGVLPRGLMLVLAGEDCRGVAIS